MPVCSGDTLKRQVPQRRKPGKNNDFRSTETMNDCTPVNDNRITMSFRHLNLKNIRNVNHKFKKCHTIKSPYIIISKLSINHGTITKINSQNDFMTTSPPLLYKIINNSPDLHPDNRP